VRASNRLLHLGSSVDDVGCATDNVDPGMAFLHKELAIITLRGHSRTLRCDRTVTQSQIDRVSHPTGSTDPSASARYSHEDNEQTGVTVATRLPLISTAQRRARLAVRHHLAAGARAADPARAAHALIGLHSTDPASVYLSARARVPGLSHADIDDALYDARTIVKHMAMRRTVWALPTELVPVVQVAASDAIAANERRRLARDLERSAVTRDGAAWVRKAEAAAMEVLAELGPTFGRALSTAVPMLRTKVTIGSGPNAQQVGVVTRIATILSASGKVTRARAGGAWHERQPRWVRMADWVPAVTESAPIAPEAARQELVRRWLRAFGPAPFDDLVWWTGWNVTTTRSTLQAVKTVEVELDDGSIGIVLEDDLGTVPAPSPWVALLPSLDPTTMGWKHRDWYLGGHRGLLFDQNGNAGPTIWADGRIIGGWAQRPGGEVVVRLLEDVGSEVARAVEEEAARLTCWLDGVPVRPSFPTPLQRELSA
jgi:hypothetical protein